MRIKRVYSIYYICDVNEYIFSGEVGAEVRWMEGWWKVRNFLNIRRMFVVGKIEVYLIFLSKFL